MIAAFRLLLVAAVLGAAVPSWATVWAKQSVYSEQGVFTDGVSFPSPIFDTGDATTATWGPTAYTSMPSQTGAALSPTIYLLGQNADDTEWVDTGSRALDMIRSLASATEYDKATAFADGTKALSVDRNARYSSSAVATPATSGDWAFVLVASVEYSGSGSDNALSWDPGSPSWRARIDINASRDITFGYRRSTLSNGSVRCRAAAATGLRGGKLVMTVIHSATLGRVRSYCNGVYEEDDIGSVVGDGATAVLDFARAPADTSGDFDLIAMWEGDICDTSDECDTTAAEHFARLSGSYLDTGGAPSTSTRASTAYLRKCDPDTDTITYHLVGENWPRREVDCGYSNFSDPTASETTVASFLQEAATTSSVDYGHTFTDVAWTKTRATVDDDTETGPLGLGCDGIVASVDNDSHHVSISVDSGSAGTSVNLIAKAGDQDWFAVRRSSNYYALFDLSSCTPGSFHDNVTGSDCRDLGNGFCHCMFTDDTSTGGGTTSFYPATGDDVNGDRSELDFVGDASTVNTILCAVWNDIASEAGFTSPILTTSATNVTRSADTLQYTLDSTLLRPLTLVADVYFNDELAPLNAHFVTLHEDFSAGGDRVNLAYSSTNAIAQYRYGTSQSIGSWAGPADGRHILRQTMPLNNGETAAFYGDGTSRASGATTYTNHDGINYVCVAQDCAGSVIDHAVLPVYRVKTYAGLIAPGEQGTGDDTP
jgi:hypothetical protein